MDYEKKYKDALAWVGSIYPKLSHEHQMEAEAFFSELKESEGALTWLKTYIEEESYYLSMDIRDEEDRIKLKKLQNALDCLEKQSNTIPDECVFRPVVGCDIESAAKQAIKQQGVLAKEVVLAFNGAYIPVKGKTQDLIVNEYNSWIEKQGIPNQVSIWKHWKDGIAGNGEGEPIYLIKNGYTYSLSSCLSYECDYIELSELDNLMIEKQGKQKSA